MKITAAQERYPDLQIGEGWTISDEWDGPVHPYTHEVFNGTEWVPACTSRDRYQPYRKREKPAEVPARLHLLAIAHHAIHQWEISDGMNYEHASDERLVELILQGHTRLEKKIEVIKNIVGSIR